jgi:hypothetical protein
MEITIYSTEAILPLCFAGLCTRDRGSVARASTGAEVGNLLSGLKQRGHGRRICEISDTTIDVLNIAP